MYLLPRRDEGSDLPSVQILKYDAERDVIFPESMVSIISFVSLNRAETQWDEFRDM